MSADDKNGSGGGSIGGDEPPEPPANKKEKESDFDRDLKRGPVLPANEDLFNFLDGLFSGDGEFPEHVDVRAVKGRNRDVYGNMVKTFPFKSGSAKPGRQRIVMMCNEIVLRLRQRTDVVGKKADYMVGAMHSARGADYYDIMLLSVNPGKQWRGRGEELGIDPSGDGSDEDLSFHDRYNLERLSHDRQMFGLVGGMIEGLLDRSDRQAQFAFQQLERLQARNIDLTEAMTRMASMDDERKERAEKSKMWRENIGKGFELAWGLVPPMLLAGKKGNNSGWTEGTVTNEAYTLKEYFKPKHEGGKFTRDQFQVIFGKLSDDNQTLIAPGILTSEQTNLLAGIANAQLNPDLLDELLEGGKYEIKKEQFMEIIGSGISIELFAPLKMLFDVRMAKREQKNGDQK